MNKTIKFENLNTFILEGKEIYPNLIEKEPILSSLTENINNTILKVDSNPSFSGVNINGDYQLESTVILEGIILNTLKQINSPHFPKIYDFFTYKNEVYLQIQNIGIPFDLKKLSEDQLKVVLFQILYALYQGSIYDFCHNNLNIENILIEYIKPEIKIYNIYGIEFQMNNFGINVIITNFEFSRITIYETYIFNSDLKNKLYPQEYDVPYSTSDILKLKEYFEDLPNESLENIFKSKFFKMYKIGGKFFINKPYLNTYHKINLSLNNIPKNLYKSKQFFYRLILLLIDYDKMKNFVPINFLKKYLLGDFLQQFFNFLYNSSCNRLLFRFLETFSNNLKISYSQLKQNNYANIKALNKIIQIYESNNKYIPKIINIEVFEPNLIKNINLEEWLSFDDNFIIKFRDTIYGSNKIYFKDIPLNNIIVEGFFKNNFFEYVKSINSIQYINLENYGIPGLINKNDFLTALPNKNIFEVIDTIEIDGINYNYLINNPKGHSHNFQHIYGLTDEEYKSIQKYTYIYYKNINEYLRSHLNDQEYLENLEMSQEKSWSKIPAVQRLNNTKNLILNLDKVFEKSLKVEIPFVVFRGVKHDEIIQGILPEFLSTSINIDMYLNGVQDFYIYEFILQIGVPYIYVEPITSIKYEYEILLPRGLKVTFLEIKKILGYNIHVMNVELVSENQFLIEQDYFKFKVLTLNIDKEPNVKNECYQNQIISGEIIDSYSKEILENSFVKINGRCYNIDSVQNFADEQRFYYFSLNTSQYQESEIEIRDPFTRFPIDKELYKYIDPTIIIDNNENFNAKIVLLKHIPENICNRKIEFLSIKGDHDLFCKNLNENKKVEFKEYSFQQCENLTRLTINYIEITDVIIPDLISLNLDYTYIQDLKKLNLDSNTIKFLSLKHTSIQQIEEILYLKKLIVLVLSNTRVVNINSLSSCVNLSILLIDHTNVIDISPLKKCKELIFLNLSFSQISNLNVLANCQKLITLILNDTLIKNISKINKCTKLKNLIINNTEITNINFLINHPIKINIICINTKITNFKKLENNKNIKIFKEPEDKSEYIDFMNSFEDMIDNKFDVRSSRNFKNPFIFDK